MREEEKTTSKCHVCEENETDIECQGCDEPVCENCCVVPTYMNQLEEARCTMCQDRLDVERWRENDREVARQDALEAKRVERRKKMRENYSKPENVEKRRLRKIERKRLQAEREMETMKRLASVFSSMFRGM